MKSAKASWLLAALMGVCLPASAQVINTKIHVNIPFNFVAGHEYLSAGHYTIVPVSEESVTTWRITSEDDRASVSMITRAAMSPVKIHHRGVMFQQLGGRYVLTEFWTTEHSGREIPKASPQTLEAVSGKDVEITAE